MHPADPQLAEEALAALLHRLASPLGAIANYAFLLPQESAPEVRAGILESMDSARGTLQDAQRWLDALATTREPAAKEGVDLAALLCAEAERHASPVRVEVCEHPRVALPPATAARIVEAVLADATAGGDAAELRLECAAGDGVHLVIVQGHRVWTETEAARAFDLFSPRDSESNVGHGELALVGSLARQVGGRTWGAVGPAGEPVVHLVLPVAIPGTAQDDEERQDA